METFAEVILDLGKSASPHRWSRKGWNGPGQFIEVQRPDTHSKMTKPYLFINTVQCDRIPWAPSQTDLLAEDWYIVT